jgi:hypothetical protein
LGESGPAAAMLLAVTVDNSARDTREIRDMVYSDTLLDELETRSKGA